MARSNFGGGVNDYVAGVYEFAGKQLVDLEAATVTFWSAEVGGSQYTDLILAGNPVTRIAVTEGGQVPQFQGPDGVLAMWADAGGARVLMVDATGAAASAAASAAAAAAVGTTNDTVIAGRIGDSASATTAQLDKQRGKVFTPEQFGGGVGVADNYAAFTALAAAVTAAGGGTVQYQPGTYVIGQNIVSGNGITDITFTNCNGLVFLGYGTKIDVKGNFNRAASTTRAVQPFRLVGCNNVSLEGFEVDGNVDQMTNSSGSTEPASQLVALYGCTNVSMRNLDLHHGSCDGIAITKTGTVACRNVSAENVKTRMNARMGMSIIHLKGGSFRNCTFNDTGTSAGTYGTHAPSCGVDIEPNVAAVSLGVDVDTGDIIFTGCQFTNNIGQQFIAVYSDRIANITLKDCTADSSTGQTSTASVVCLSVNGGVIEGGTIISRVATCPAVLPVYSITGPVIRTTVRNVRIVGVDRAILAGVAAIDVLFEGCKIELTGTSVPANSGRGILATVIANFTMRNCRFFVPAGQYGGSGSNYAIAAFAAGNVIDRCFFDTDLVPSTTEHFEVGLSTATVSNVTFTNLASQPIRPVGSSTHDPAFPFGRGDVALGNKQWLGRGSNGSGSGNSLSSGSAAPATGTWKKGEIVFSTAVAASGKIGWVCTVAGTPGTWKAFGVIDA